MKFFYFLVYGNKAWKDGLGFHENYFEAQSGFILGLLIALVVAVLIAAIFYFGLCMSKSTFKQATMTNWIICLVVTGVVAFFGADMMLIGTQKDKKRTPVTFHQANTKYISNLEQGKVKGKENPTVFDIQQHADKKETITKALNRWGDVRMQFDLSVALWALVIYFVVSVGFKGMTTYGRAIPFKWPGK